MAFVDFGHSKTTVTIASFVKAKCKILGTHSDRNLGARDIDYQIMEKVGEEFAKKHGYKPQYELRPPKPIPVSALIENTTGFKEWDPFLHKS